MRLAYSDTEKRLPIKLDKSMAGDDSLGGIMTFGADNLYPQTIESLIAGSPDGKIMLRNVCPVFNWFLGENELINKIVIGTDERGKDITVIQLLRAAAQSVSKKQRILYSRK